jgi:hypothetical protein
MSRARVVLSVIGWRADKVIYGLPFFLFAAGHSQSAANAAYFPRPRVGDLEPDIALGDLGNGARLVAPNTVSRYGLLIHVNNKGRA